MCSQRCFEGVVFSKSDGSEQPQAKNMPDQKQELLRALPAITELLKSETAAGWLRQHPQPLVTECLRRALAGLRRQILNGDAGPGGAPPITAEAVLAQAEKILQHATEPHLREAINATGIILHTGLGRAVLPAGVVDSMMGELKGYCTLAVDRDSGERAERDELVEYILTELTGAEAATVVNNNAAATLLALAALAAQKEVIVSRGQLIEIGGSFRLPEVMAQSGARLVEVGATNRTHLKDYQKAVTENTAAILRVHPSNYRVVGFTSEVAAARTGGTGPQPQFDFDGRSRRGRAGGFEAIRPAPRADRARIHRGRRGRRPVQRRQTHRRRPVRRDRGTKDVD